MSVCLINGFTKANNDLRQKFFFGDEKKIEERSVENGIIWVSVNLAFGSLFKFVNSISSSLL